MLPRVGDRLRRTGARLREATARFGRVGARRFPIAEGPMRFVQRLGHDDVAGLSAELAYRFFLALFPFAVFVAALGAFVASWLGVEDPSGRILRSFGAALPTEVAALVGDELRRIVARQDVGLLSIGALAALWFATGGTNAVLKALNRAYGLGDARPLWRTYPLAIGFTLGGGSLIVALVVAFVALELAGTDAAARLGIEPLWQALLVLRWVLAVLVLTAMAAVLYRLGTVARAPWRAILPGALAFAVAWLAVTLLFAFYVDTLGNYGAAYGALAGVAGLLVWLYLSAFAFLLGAELTATLFDAGRRDGRT